MNRRLFLKVASSGILFPSLAFALSKKEANNKYPYLSGSKNCLAQQSASWEIDRVGVPPSSDDLRRAVELLTKIPTKKLPIEIAEWMATCTELSKNNELFRSRWLKVSNPLIPWYFAFTDESPCNDLFDWCAAFISWSLAQSGRERLPYADLVGNINALKRYGKNIDEVKRGDVIFLKRKSGGGHVAYFIEKTVKGIRLLGGNQRGQICEHDYELNGSFSFVFGVSASSFKPVNLPPIIPKNIEGVNHLVATEQLPTTWPVCH